MQTIHNIFIYIEMQIRRGKDYTKQLEMFIESGHK